MKVWFLQGEQMIALSRPGASAEGALRQLLRGPTQAETKRGVETYVLTFDPAKARVLR